MQEGGDEIVGERGWHGRVGDQDALATVEMDDPFDTLTTALGGALGLTRREAVEAVVNAQLN